MDIIVTWPVLEEALNKFKQKLADVEALVRIKKFKLGFSQYY